MARATALAAAREASPARRRETWRIGARLASLLAFAACWFAIAAVAHSRVLPGPLAVGRKLLVLAATGQIFVDTAITLARVAVSFVIAMLVGSAIGIVLGRRARLDAFFDAWLVIALNVPALVTIILCYVWFGLSESAAILAVAVNKIPLVAVQVREGARAIDPELMAMAEAFAVPPWRRFRRVFLPQLTPYLMGAARSGLALIWKIVLVVELLGRPDGVGFRLGEYFQYFDIAGVLAYSLVFIGVVLLIEMAIFRPLERRLNAWRL